MTSYRTASGRTVVVRPAEHPAEWGFEIDGEEATVLVFQLYRDGGSRRYETDRGVVYFPHRLTSDDRTPRLDREPLTEEKPRMMPCGGVIQPSWPEYADAGPLWMVLRHVVSPGGTAWPAGYVIPDVLKRKAVEAGTLREDDVAQADGGTLSRRQFPELYAAIGRTYGPPEPKMRPATRWERLVYWLSGSWADSYVEDRLAYAQEMERWVRRRDEFKLPDLRGRVAEAP